jgi:hypothetical protein
MSKSLIRKNQLHPDIAELISGYGDNFFITPFELEQAILSLEGEINLSTVVYTTGNQNINGIKNFTSRPTFNGLGLATTGEAGAGSTIFNGNRSITANVLGLKDLTPGGNDVSTFLNNVFYPFSQATLTLNNFNTIYELGTTLGNVNFIGTIITGSLNINQLTNLQGFIDGVSRPDPVTPSVNFNFPVQVNLTNTSTNVTVKANSRNQENQIVQITSEPKTIHFEAPFYFGVGFGNLTPVQIQSQLTKRVELKSDKVLSYLASNNQKLYFAYPQSWGSLLEIRDQNGFNNTAGWLNRPNSNFTLSNGSTHVYIIRETNSFLTFSTPFSYTFDF